MDCAGPGADALAKGLTKAWAVWPDPRPIRESFATSSKARSMIVMVDLLWRLPAVRSCSLAAATTCSGVKPNFFTKSLSGADAPKERMPMLCPVSPDVLGPAERRGLLHRDPRSHFRRQHTVAVLLRLIVEQFPRRHAHHPRFDSLGFEPLVALPGTAPPRCRLPAAGRPAGHPGRRPERTLREPIPRQKRTCSGRSSARPGG